MPISITYCGQWNYLPYAASLAEVITKTFGIEPKLVRGNKGIFDIVVDGKLIFSKYDTGRFPENGEIVKLLRQELE